MKETGRFKRASMIRPTNYKQDPNRVIKVSSTWYVQKTK